LAGCSLYPHCHALFLSVLFPGKNHDDATQLNI
jgi:hypothetical protein